MTLQDFRDLLHAEPFQPFTLHLADDKSIEVVHPDFAATPPGNLRTVAVFTPDRRLHYVDLLLVTNLETAQRPDPEMPTSIPSPDNGRP